LTLLPLAPPLLSLPKEVEEMGEREKEKGRERGSKEEEIPPYDPLSSPLTLLPLAPPSLPKEVGGGKEEEKRRKGGRKKIKPPTDVTQYFVYPMPGCGIFTTFPFESSISSP
jgi:hypothetical protein